MMPATGHNRLNRGRGLALSLGGLALVLAGVNVVVTRMDIASTERSVLDTAELALPELSIAVPLSPERTDNTAGLYPQITERPLFHVSRRPPAPPVVPAVSPETMKKKPEPVAKAFTQDVRLIGIMRRGPGGHRALVRAGADDKARWISTGSELDGWRVVKVDHKGVTLDHNGMRHRLSLHGSAEVRGAVPKAAAQEAE